jgi:hypothetical protein
VRPVARRHRRADGQRDLDGGDHSGRDPAARAQHRGSERRPHPDGAAARHQRRRRIGSRGRVQRAGPARPRSGERVQAGRDDPAREHVARRRLGDRGLVCRDGREPPSGRLSRHRDPDGGRVPQARRGPAPRQEHVRARHPLQPLQPRRGTRAPADPRHVPQEGRAGRRAERRAARGGLDVGGGEPRLPLRDPCRAIEGAADRRQRQHRARAWRARLGNGHLRDVPDHARHVRLALPERHVRARRRHRPSGRGRDRRVHVRDRRVLRGPMRGHDHLRPGLLAEA